MYGVIYRVIYGVKVTENQYEVNTLTSNRWTWQWVFVGSKKKLRTQDLRK